jgi:hypothetical protein
VLPRGGPAALVHHLVWHAHRAVRIEPLERTLRHLVRHALQ